MSEPPLTDRELRVLRGLIDDHEQARLIDRWFAVRWKFLAGVFATLSGVAILVASIVQLVHDIGGK